jgi:hypothetical protein
MVGEASRFGRRIRGFECNRDLSCAMLTACWGLRAAQTNCRSYPMSVLHRLWSYLGRKAPSDNPRMLIQGKPAPFSLDPELVEHIKSLTPSSDWTKIELPGKPKMLMDRDMIEYIQSPKPQPSQRSLDEMLKRAHSFRVIDGGVSPNGRPLINLTLYETSDEKMLADLRHFLRIVDGPAGHCMCHGDTAVELRDEFSECLATISVHHGMSIRWNAWKDDAALVDGYSLLEFLADVIQYPLDIYLGCQNDRTAEEADWKRWLAAMPLCLRPLLADQGDTFTGYVAYQPPADWPRPTHGPQNWPPAHMLTRERWNRVRQALQDAYPDSMQRVQVLFQWFGQGGGLWSGFAVYEQVPEMLLMDMPIEDLLRALHGPSLPQPLLEGATRFLAGWTFATRRGAELDLLPADLRQQLLKYSLQTEDPDKRARAAAAFQRNTTLT